jgi:hypothetical protein
MRVVLSAAQDWQPNAECSSGLATWWLWLMPVLVLVLMPYSDMYHKVSKFSLCDD